MCLRAERIEKTIEIDKKSMEIEEKGVKLRLTIVDTPGFNDSVDARHWYVSLLLLLLPPPKARRLSFWFGLFVCLSVG